MKTRFTQRDNNIELAFKREISLHTRVSKDKSKFSRKIKHKNKIYA
ncbi:MULTISPECIES: hypothetical protein [unclassified Campylobacter]|nr:MULTISPECIES: hypothetical protein [unclassified Campylobacter]